MSGVTQSDEIPHPHRVVQAVTTLPEDFEQRPGHPRDRYGTRRPAKSAPP